MTTTEDWGRKVVAGNAAQSVFYATHGGRDQDAAPMDDDLEFPRWGVFDNDRDDFIKACWLEREADAVRDGVEQGAYLDGSGVGGYIPDGKGGHRWAYRFTVELIPEDHPLAQDMRA